MAWLTEDEKPFATTLEATAEDRDGLLFDIAASLTSLRVRTREITGKDLPGGKCQFTITFEVKDVSELSSVMNKIRGISGMLQVKRGQN